MDKSQQKVIEKQVNQARQQSAQTGFSGTAILDIHPSTGIIRIKVSPIPPEAVQQFITNYANVLVMSLNALNIDVKTHVAEEAKGD